MIYEILTAVLTIIGALLTIWATKSSKAKKYLQDYNKVREQVEYYIEVAEKMENATGAEKKKFVVDVIMGYIEYNRLPITKDLVELLVDQIVAITKKVNIK